MSKNAKALIIAVLLTAGLLGGACGPAAAAVRIEGQVQGGGGPIANSTVTLWAASANAPSQLAQVKTDANGGFEISVEQSPGNDTILYLVAKGGEPTVNKARRRQSRDRADDGAGQQAPGEGHHQRDDDRGVGVDPRAVPRRHRDQGSRAQPAHRRGQRAQLRRSRNRRLGRRNSGPAQQRPDADDGQLRHAGRRACRLRHAGDSRMPAASCSQRPRRRRATRRPTR